MYMLQNKYMYRNLRVNDNMLIDGKLDSLGNVEISYLKLMWNLIIFVYAWEKFSKTIAIT